MRKDLGDREKFRCKKPIRKIDLRNNMTFEELVRRYPPEPIQWVTRNE